MSAGTVGGPAQDELPGEVLGALPGGLFGSSGLAVCPVERSTHLANGSPEGNGSLAGRDPPRSSLEGFSGRVDTPGYKAAVGP